MLSSRDILLGIVLPLVASALILLLGRLARRRAAVGGALAVGIGFVLGCELVFGRTRLPPPNAFEWVIPLAALAAVVGTLAELASFRLRWAWGVLIAATAYATLSPLHSPWTLATSAALGWLWWGLFDALLKRAPAPCWAGTVMTGVAGLASLVLLLSDSQRIGQMGLSLLGATAGAWILGWALKRNVWRGAALAWAVVLYGLLLDGKFWAGLTWLNAALLLAAPLAAWVGELPGVRNLIGWKRGAVRVLAVVVPTAVAVVLAVLAFQQAQQSTGAEYY